VEPPENRRSVTRRLINDDHSGTAPLQLGNLATGRCSGSARSRSVEQVGTFPDVP
jgi:hypothetical protein